MKAVAHGSVREDAVADVMGWPGQRDRAERVAGSLVADGLLVLDAGRYRHP